MKRSWLVFACLAPLLPQGASALPREAGAREAGALAAGAREARPPQAASALGCPPGFAAVSGTSTCVKVSGRVRTEFVTSRAWSAGGALRSEGRIGLEARTQTGYGQVRTVVRVRTGRDGF